MKLKCSSRKTNKKKVRFGKLLYRAMHYIKILNNFIHLNPTCSSLIILSY